MPASKNILVELEKLGLDIHKSYTTHELDQARSGFEKKSKEVTLEERHAEKVVENQSQNQEEKQEEKTDFGAPDHANEAQHHLENNEQDEVKVSTPKKQKNKK